MILKFESLEKLNNYYYEQLNTLAFNSQNFNNAITSMFEKNILKAYKASFLELTADDNFISKYNLKKVKYLRKQFILKYKLEKKKFKAELKLSSKKEKRKLRAFIKQSKKQSKQKLKAERKEKRQIFFSNLKQKRKARWAKFIQIFKRKKNNEKKLKAK